MLEALRRRGHEVVLATNLTGIADGTAVPVQHVDLGPKLSSRTAGALLKDGHRVLWRLARVLWDNRPVATTLVHFKKEQLLIALLPPRLTGRIVWAEWGPVPPQLRSGVPRRLYALAGRRAASVIAVSEGTRRTVIEAGIEARKVVVVPNFIDTDEVHHESSRAAELRATWGADESTFVIGCISRFQRRKRNDVVIDALESVDGDVLLVLAGEGDEEPELRRRAAKYGERVRFVGNVRGDVATFLSACDVLVFAPSPTEGAPRVIAMAQLVGVPVVATDPEGAAEMIPPGGGTIVSPSHDPSALASALVAYRDDPERRRREAAVAYEAARQRYAPERLLGSLEQALGVPRP